MPISIERSKFTKVLGINRKSMRKKRGIKLERKKCDMSSRSPLYSYRYSYMMEWMGGQVRKYEEATANIYKYFRGINIWRSPVFGKHVSRVVIFSIGEKKLRFRSVNWEESERVSFHEFPSPVSSVSREMIIRATSTHCSTFHSEYLLGETTLNSVTRTSLELLYVTSNTTERVNSIRDTHTRYQKKKNTLRKSIHDYVS